MNLTIDIGNTTIKIGVFEGKELVAHTRCDADAINNIIHFIHTYNPLACIISSTSHDIEAIKNNIHDITPHTKIIEFNHLTKIPVKNSYQTPETLGMDRLAAVIGAYVQKHGNNILVIDAGTAITYDIITANGEYLGGNISPGINMRFKALHEYTSKLPLVINDGEKSDIGINTETAIRNGVLNGTKYEIEGVINHFSDKYPGLLVFLTGGNDFDFDERIKKRIFVDKILVLRGLNEVLLEQIQ